MTELTPDRLSELRALYQEANESDNLGALIRMADTIPALVDEIERLRRERKVLAAAVEARGRFAAHLLSCGVCRPIDTCPTGRDLEDEWLVAQDEALALLDGEKGGGWRE